MGDTATLVSGIEYKIRKLIEQYESTRRETETLIEANRILKQTNENQKKTIEQLEEKMSLLNLSRPDSDPESKMWAKGRINELLREIDKCIRLLSTQG